MSAGTGERPRRGAVHGDGGDLEALEVQREGARALAVSRANDALYCAYYKGPDAGPGTLHWLKYNSDYENPWSTEQSIPTGQAYPGLDTAPCFGLIYLVYRG
ncbi:hypothetical protein ABTZ03_43380 [Kitasatospora sp. NPDC096077]|uniref:hypothetical protein n=1 Tax=Kitasatospora sp. NPDC096077 TaxID=3155544 RepID=UPI003322E3F9